MGKDAFNWSKVKVKGIYNVTKCIEFLFIEESWICPQKIISSTYQLFSSLIIINFFEHQISMLNITYHVTGVMMKAENIALSSQ